MIWLTDEHRKIAEEFYRRTLILCHQRKSVIAGRYHRKRFHLGGMHFHEVVRTHSLTVIPRVIPHPEDNYQLQVGTGAGMSDDIIFIYRKIGDEAAPKISLDPKLVMAFLPNLRQLTVLDELALG